MIDVRNNLFRGAVILSIALCPAIAAAQLYVLHAFPATSLGDGSEAANAGNSAPWLIEAAGALYGTTIAGGTSGNGTVFKLTPPAAGQSAWTETILHDFSGTDGASPPGGLVMDRGGALYGATLYGGRFNAGTVYKLSPASGNAAWTLQSLFDFKPGSKLGTNPVSGLLIDAAGALYGTNASGSAFKLSPPSSGSGAWTATKLGNIGGSGFLTTLTFGAGGVIYGSYQSAPHGVFELLPPGSGAGKWRVRSIGGLRLGQYPQGGVLPDPSGALYGTAFNSTSCGIVFKLSPPVSGKTWPETILHRFSGTDGCDPGSSLIEDASGALYGTTTLGGASSKGVVFRLALKNGRWTETVLADLDQDTGGYPSAGLTLDAAGNLFGVTAALGPDGNLLSGGTVFEISIADIAQRVAASRP
jgi:uncharacterized repeat protein (TIGR03803 family)